MKRSVYYNPIINKDMSDPDVIKYKDGYLLITSSFSFLPGIPLYYSLDLVNWKFVRYIVKKLPFKKYNRVHFGHGIWAPSLRVHNDIVYVVFPTPDEGIFVTYSKNPFSSWSKVHHLKSISGYEDPCPIWYKNKTYVVHAYVKSRIGFNSKLAIFETDEKLENVLSESKIIYDGSNDNPTIEGPKFNIINDELFILAPAGGVEEGYQLALKGEDIYGPYVAKRILQSYPTLINGPHQGSLVEYEKDKYVFFHFQDKGALGRVLHLQPVKIENGFPFVGDKIKDYEIGGPTLTHSYYLKKHVFKKNNTYFVDNKFPDTFTYACNKIRSSYFIKDNIFNLNCLYEKDDILHTRNAIYKDIIGPSFIFKTKIKTNFINNEEEGGLIILGKTSYVIKIINNELSVLKIDLDSLSEEIIYKDNSNKKVYNITLSVNDLNCTIYINNQKINTPFILTKGKWVGSKIGFYARANKKNQNKGSLKIYKTIIKKSNG